MKKKRKVRKVLENQYLERKKFIHDRMFEDLGLGKNFSKNTKIHKSAPYITKFSEIWRKCLET